jgi:hypothetical protein
MIPAFGDMNLDQMVGITESIEMKRKHTTTTKLEQFQDLIEKSERQIQKNPNTYKHARSLFQLEIFKLRYS